MLQGVARWGPVGLLGERRELFVDGFDLDPVGGCTSQACCSVSRRRGVVAFRKPDEVVFGAGLGTFRSDSYLLR